MLIFFSVKLFSQPINVIVTNIAYPEEPSIHINPKNPALVMAGVNINYIYLSTDSGKTWTGQYMNSDNGVWGDPCIITDTFGNFLYLHLANPPLGNWIDRIVFQKYEIDSNKWTTDSYMGLNGTKAQDKEWCVVDPSNNVLYTSWTEFDDYGSTSLTDSSRIMFSKSVDGGANWSAAKKINKISGDCIDSDNTTEGAVPAIGPNGQIYISWAGPAGIRFDRSLDGGDSWLDDDILVDPMPTGWDYEIPGISRANGLPITLCDLSGGPFHGHVYINWSDQRNGANNTDVFMSKSTDGGLSWSSPLRLNNDTTQTHQFFTWMTIDQTNGWLYSVFYDRRNYTDNHTDVYLAISKNGGQSFDNYLISNSPFNPNQNIFFGDYTNISAYNGMIRPIWARLHNDSLSVLTALIQMDSSGGFVGYNPIIQQKQLTEVDIFPNPSTDRVAFAYKLKHSATISIEISDNQGKKIVDLVSNQQQSAGMYIEHLDSKNHNLKPGVYYFNLLADSKIIRTKQFVIQ